MLVDTLSAIPQLKKDQIAQHGSALPRRIANGSPNLRISTAAQSLDPGGGVHENPIGHDQVSSRIRCSSS